MHITQMLQHIYLLRETADHRLHKKSIRPQLIFQRVQIGKLYGNFLQYLPGKSEVYFQNLRKLPSINFQNWFLVHNEIKLSHLWLPKLSAHLQNTTYKERLKDLYLFRLAIRTLRGVLVVATLTKWLLLLWQAPFFEPGEQQHKHPGTSSQ